MTRSKRSRTLVKAAKTPAPNATAQGRNAQFDEVVALIQAARGRAYQAVNTELVTLYWQLGQYISDKIASAEWGDGVVEELARELLRLFPGQRGFTRRNLFRMRQFYEAYAGREKVSALLTQLPWTHHLILMSQVKQDDAREFYLLTAIRERWSSRELERQIASGAALRSLTAPKKKVSPAVTQLRPSIGVLLCANKDDEVVEFTLARTVSPTLVAEYRTVLPPKEILRAKLHELYALAASETGQENDETKIEESDES